MKGLSAIDKGILAELRGHLERADDWAHPDDLSQNGEWSPIGSTLQAVVEGNVGLALTRWDDLLFSVNRPLISQAAEEWRAK